LSTEQVFQEIVEAIASFSAVLKHFFCEDRVVLRNLPVFVQKQLLNYVATNNLSAAKSLYEAWYRNHGLAAYLPLKQPKRELSGTLFLSSQQEVWLERMLTSD
jgi:hypothetical protein